MHAVEVFREDRVLGAFDDLGEVGVVAFGRDPVGDVADEGGDAAAGLGGAHDRQLGAELGAVAAAGRQLDPAAEQSAPRGGSPSPPARQ